MMVRSKESTFLLSYYPGSLQDLPLVSPVAVRLAGTARQRPLSRDELASAFESDVFLCAKVVSVANSIFFNFTHTPCFTIDEALARVGHDFAEALLRNASQIAEPLAREMAGKLWVHCMATASLVKELHPHAAKVTQSSGAAYWAAMIHDIGFLIEANFEQQNFAEVLQSFGEREGAGDGHCVLAHGLAHYWGLPAWVKELLRWHHSAIDCESGEVAPLAGLLHIAHAIAQFKEDEIEPRHLSDLGLPPSSLAQAVGRRHRIFEGLTASLRD
jgi:HD-like signal output (HDOD) protein